MYLVRALGIALLSVASMATPSSKNMKVPLVDMKADSKAGRKLISKAKQRNLEDQEFQDYDSLYEYSIKFLSCYRWFEWNDEADGDEDLRLAAKRIVQFRLCPTKSCTDGKNAGCDSNYGEFIIDMETYLVAYYDMLGEDNDDYGVQQVMNYLQCDRFRANRELSKNENADNRNLGYYDVLYDDDIYEREFYIGPYCTEDGIEIGLFTEDTCTMVAGGESSSNTNGGEIYYQLTGNKLPFVGESIVSRDCINCERGDEDGGLSEFCEDMYADSGKCEKEMDFNTPNTNACQFVSGLWTLRSDGFFGQDDTHPSTTATVFIVLFAFASAGLGFYCWYLYQKLNPTQKYFYE
mmetsp:Transcript_17586/g.27393  ORF Transcript_17586/g.27393 Transcript_17586/m.27393 type:complete len:350 (+) Transcript_17586:156-1205(+)